MTVQKLEKVARERGGGAAHSAKKRTSSYAQAVNFNWFFFLSIPFGFFQPIEALNYQLGFKPESRNEKWARATAAARIENRIEALTKSGVMGNSVKLAQKAYGHRAAASSL